MIDVKEDQLLFPQHDECCVKQLQHLGEDEEVRPEAGHLVLRNEGRGAGSLARGSLNILISLKY